MKINPSLETERNDSHPVLEPTPISSWMDLVPSLRKKLAELGYEGTKVIIRHYDRDRTELVQTKGTDRDEDSRVWDYREDVCAEGQGRGLLAGRFRHRLFVALLPEATASGPVEDRPVVRARCAQRSQRCRDCQDHHRTGPEPGAGGDRRGR